MFQLANQYGVPLTSLNRWQAIYTQRTRRSTTRSVGAQKAVVTEMGRSFGDLSPDSPSWSSALLLPSTVGELPDAANQRRPTAQPRVSAVAPPSIVPVLMGYRRPVQLRPEQPPRGQELVHQAPETVVVRRL